MKASETDFWQRLFYALIAIYGVVVLTTFSSYGITTDEPLHVAYGEHIAKWYGSLFRDHTVFMASNLWLYGGFFDVVIYVLKHVVPMDVYELRHLVCGFLGVLGVLGAYRVGALLGGPRAGFLAALFLILTPRYYGHVFNNTKDIPFAVGYLWSLYYLIRCVGVLPHLSRDLIWKLGVVVGLTFGIRSSAALLVCYLGLFFLLRYVQVWRFENAEILSDWQRQVLCVLGVGVVTYVTVFPFFPYLHIHPITGLLDSLTAFSRFPEVHYNFYHGQYMASNALPWHYIPQWLLITIPEFVMMGVLVGGICVVWKMSFTHLQSVKGLQVGVLVFAGVFPIVFGVVSHTPLLNGIRHLTFVIPPLVVVSALGVSEAICLLKQIWVLRLMGAVFCTAMLAVVFDMVTMHPNQYVYFNRVFGGGLAEASKSYDTDYWNHTYKQGVRWIEAQATSKAGEAKPVIGSLYKNVAYMVDRSRFEFRRTQLHHANYYVGNTFFDAHRAIPGDILHTVDVQGVPLLYVIRPDASRISDPFFDSAPLAYDLLGDALRKDGDLDVALVAYGRTLERLDKGFKRIGIDSSGVMHKMGNVLLGLDRYDDALAIFEQIPDSTFDGSIANNIASYYIDKKAYEQALPWLMRAVDVSPKFYVARTNLGYVYLALGDTVRAIATYREAADRNTQNADRQLTLGKLFYRTKSYEDARVCFQRCVDLKYDHVQAHYYLGLTQAALENYQQARLHFEQTVALAPDYVDAYQNLGTACMYLKDFKAAAKAYRNSLALDADLADVYTLLGVALMNLKDFDGAHDAFDKALALNPSDMTALSQRRFLGDEKNKDN
jgi:tetratricopeptide (TPR) repeat protein